MVINIGLEGGKRFQAIGPVRLEAGLIAVFENALLRPGNARVDDGLDKALA